MTMRLVDVQLGEQVTRVRADVAERFKATERFRDTRFYSPIEVTPIPVVDVEAAIGLDNV